jgi:hypothetical protein
MATSYVAKKWTPSTSEQDIMDKLAAYYILARHCARKLREVEEAFRAMLYDQLKVVFMNDPVKYPSAMPNVNDVKGEKEFLGKCDAICFPSSPPCTPEE